MAPMQPPRLDEDFGGYAGFDEDPLKARGLGRRRTVTRYGVPLAVAGLAAVTVGIGTALAGPAADPSLPNLTAEQVLTKMATSTVRTVSGSVRVTMDFGIPQELLGGALPGGMGAGGGPFGHGGTTGPGDGSGAPSADPQSELTGLLAGSHTLRVASDGQDRQRVSVLADTSEYTLIHNGDQVWAYDSATNQVYHEAAAGPGGSGAALPHRPHSGPGGAASAMPRDGVPVTPQEAVKQALKAVGPTTSVTVDGTADVAGRAAYRLLITPKQADTTIGSIRVAIDAANGVPLRFTLTPKDSSTPAVDIGYTAVDFGKPGASTFDFTVPKGAEVTEGKADSPADQNPMSPVNPGAGTVIGTGWDSVVQVEAAPGVAAGQPGATSGVPSLLGSLGQHVTGGFGSGTVIRTRVVNVLITDKGTIYAGAVTQGRLVQAADTAK